MSSLASISSSNFRSLFRRLLREASYLPDASARSHAKERIVSRFRIPNPTSINIGKAGIIEQPKLRLEKEELWRSLWHDGYKSLHQLQRANQGYKDDLLNVLLSTYGRKGERRQELLKTLIETDNLKGDQSDVVSKQLSKLPNFPQHISETLPRPDPRLLALLKHQKDANVRWPPSAKVKNIQLDIPARNSWLRPTPVKRVVNIVKKWYKIKLEQVLPPLPNSEWTRLEKLAHGVEKCDAPVKRRTPAKDFIAYDRAATEDCKTNKSSLLFGSGGLNSLSNNGGKEQPHTITKRYMQRLYAKVLQVSADMKWDDTSKSWTFEWGKTTSRRTRLPKTLESLKT